MVAILGFPFSILFVLRSPAVGLGVTQLAGSDDDGDDVRVTACKRLGILTFLAQWQCARVTLLRSEGFDWFRFFAIESAAASSISNCKASNPHALYHLALLNANAEVADHVPPQHGGGRGRPAPPGGRENQGRNRKGCPKNLGKCAPSLKGFGARLVGVDRRCAGQSYPLSRARPGRFMS